jgi:hypothetical protein
MARKRKAEDVHEDELDLLYRGSREDFISERNALAKRLRAEGQPELAERVRRLRKPSVSAWAVNQAVRANRPEADRLLEAGRRLRGAQEAALEGRDRDELRDAMAEEQAAVDGMVEAVRRAAGGPRALSPSVLDRATETLRAVARDDQLRDEFVAARVRHDRTAVGFGDALEALPGPRRGTKQKPRTGDAHRRRAQQRVRVAERNLDKATKRVDEARRSLKRAERGLEEARAKLERAESSRGEREGQLVDARAALAEHES